jgi:membrane fusion protein (multidrug efflux system)
MLVSQSEISDEDFAAELTASAEPSAPPAGAQEKPDSSPRPAATESATRGTASRRRRIRLALFILLPIVLIIGAWWYVTGGQVVSMTDAYVNADKVGISTDVSGIVQSVDVKENQHVQTGQILYRLDDLPFRIALARAQAQVGTVHDELQALKSNYADAAAQLQQAQYDLDYYTTEYRRVKALLESHVASQTSLDAARRNFQSARQRLASITHQRGAIAANLNGDPQSPIESNPRYRQAIAQRDEAARELAHTVVRAPFGGIVTNVPSTTPGRYLQVMGTAFYLVATDHVWVEANPKETELTYVRPGQHATVTVDTYPNIQWSGVVESISPAAAQEFSLLPPQNTSGNWVKVVQRIPIRVRVDTSGRQLPPLRAGMSVEVAVDTGHARGWPHFMAAMFGTSREH